MDVGHKTRSQRINSAVKACAVIGSSQFGAAEHSLHLLMNEPRLPPEIGVGSKQDRQIEEFKVL